MDYTKYRKSVVVMKAENKEFALNPQKEISGYLKLEIGGNRGIARIGAENLRHYLNNDYQYKLVLFGKKKKKTIYKALGDLKVDREGKGESYLRFDPVNIDGRGNAFQIYRVALVVALSKTDPKEPLHPVLRGTLEHEEEKPRGRKAKNYNNYYNQYVLLGCRAIDENKLKYDRIVPFKKDKTGAQWRRLPSPARFPMVSPDTQYILSRYRHFIFGISKTHYFIGVPGRYLEKEQPEEGRSGFTLWQPILGAESLEAAKENAPMKNRQAAYGYWIAAVDKETGGIEDMV
jgi:hypothetical protein